MKRTTLAFPVVALCGAMLTCTAAFAAAPAGAGAGPATPAAQPARPPGVQSSGATQKPMVSCSRIGLQYAAQQYLAGQAKGDYSALPLATGLGYWEQFKPVDIKTGFLTKKLNINRAFAMFDEDTCQTYVEIMVTDKAEPYVAGIRMRVTYDKIAEIDIIYETTGYWLFNADDFLKYASLEDWGPVEPSKRSTRGELVFAANAYLDAFLEAKIDAVPWGYPCVRIEGGAYTGSRDGTPTRADASCSAGVPSGVNIANRRFVVDEVLNSVVVYCTFGAGSPTGGSGAPDAHLFRLENGKLRYVHTLTALLQSAGPGAAPRAPAATPGASGPPRAPAAPAPAVPGGY